MIGVAQPAGWPRVRFVHLAAQLHELVGKQFVRWRLAVFSRHGQVRRELVKLDLLLGVERVDQLGGHVDAHVTAVEPIGVNLLRLEILDVQTEGVGLDADVDVFRDQCGSSPVLRKRPRDADDPVVRRIVAQ